MKKFLSQLLSGVSGQAQHNAFAMEQHKREIRLRKNLDQLERLTGANEFPQLKVGDTLEGETSTLTIVHVPRS